MDKPELGRVRDALAANRLDEAQAILERLLGLGPANGETLMLLASLAAKRGRLADADSFLRKCLSISSCSSDAASALAWICIQRNRPVEALGLLDGLLALAPGDLRAAVHRAWLLLQLGRLEEALIAYRNIIERQPENASLRIAYGQALIAAGHEKQAVSFFRDALALEPRSGEAWWALANIKTIRFTGPDVAAMRTTLAKSSLPERQRIPLHFALGKALEDRGEFGESFAQYHSGNEIQARGSAKPNERTRSFVDRSIELFTGDFLRSRECAGHVDPSPILIVGMPRSGSTLLEQMMASHSSIEGTSELPNINAIVQSLIEETEGNEGSYPERLATLEPSQLEELGRAYIEQAAAYRRTERPFFIDKMPSNWQHLGLIRLILPRAKIIHIRRDPLDCCFANYAQYFPRGHEFSTSLDELGIHFRLHERLIGHFEAVSPGAVLGISYERLIDDPEGELRSLFSGLGLNFEETCLRFHETRRLVLTPSAQQVRQPLNRRGIGRWKNFEPWLGPLKRALGEA